MVTVEPSERLTYRRVTREDSDILFAIDQDEEVMRFINGGRKTSRSETDDVFMPRIESFTSAEKGWGLWLVSDNREDYSPIGSPIGWILVRPMGFFTGNMQAENMELGWRFCRSSWGKGLATEAAKAVVNGLQNAGYKQFSAIALAENHASINVMKKLGMTYSHTERYTDAIFDDDVVVYTTGL